MEFGGYQKRRQTVCLRSRDQLEHGFKSANEIPKGKTYDDIVAAMQAGLKAAGL
jgi:hypothetical protein